MMIRISVARFFTTAVILLVVPYLSWAQSTTAATTTVPSDEAYCNKLTSCDQCVEASLNSSAIGCFFCGSPGVGTNGTALPACKAYTVANGLSVVTLNGGCGVLDYNVGTCVLKAYVILILILVAVILFCLIPMCVCCICVAVCCHRRKERAKAKDQRKYEDAKDEIRQKSAARKADRREKNDEIRNKYGLGTSGGGSAAEGTYKRLDN